MSSRSEGSVSSIRVYSRAGCHLCEVLLEELLPLVRGRLEVEVVDIDSRDDWREAYNTRIPVVEFDAGFVCQYSLDVGAIQKILHQYDSSSG